MSMVRHTRTALATLLAAAALVITPMAAQAAPATAVAAATNCNYNDPVAIRSNRNNKYVTTEKDYTGSTTGMLRARADVVGNWEKYYLCYQDGWGPNEFAFLAVANNRFVSAEFDYAGSNDGMLRARATEPGVWERFDWIYDISGSQLRSTWTGQYVATELDYTGTRYAMLRARSASAGIWEQYSIIWL